MAFKIGDIVFLDKRGLIGWEDNDRTVTYIKNKLYTVLYSKNNVIKLYGVGSEIHPDHFKLYEMENGKIRGCNFFRRGDKVKVVLRGKLEWEPEDYTKVDDLKDDVIYEVMNYYINDNIVVELTNGRGGLHPNHFGLV